MSNASENPTPMPKVRKVESSVADTKPMAQRQDLDSESLDQMASEAGVALEGEEELHIKDKLDERDENRYLLDPDSGHVSGSDPNADTEQVYRREGLDELPETAPLEDSEGKIREKY